MFNTSAKPRTMMLVGLGMGLLVGVGMMVGTMVAFSGSWSSRLVWPETPIHAVGSDSGTTYAAATGAIDDDVEGVFLLDYLTGDLRCAVISIHTGKFNTVFRRNVLADLGVVKTKNPRYLMVTGNANFRRGAGVFRPGLTVVYVVDVTSGNFAAYGVPWRANQSAAGRGQSGALILLDTGMTRVVLSDD